MKVSFKHVKRLPTREFFILAAKIGQKCDIRKCTAAMWQIFLEVAMFCDWDRRAAGLCTTYDTPPPQMVGTAKRGQGGIGCPPPSPSPSQFSHKRENDKKKKF